MRELWGEVEPLMVTLELVTIELSSGDSMVIWWLLVPTEVSAGLPDGWGEVESVPEMVGRAAILGRVEEVFLLFLRAITPPVTPNPRRAPKMTAKRSSLNIV